MPKFTFHLKDGKTLTLEGDEQPSDSEVESIAKEQGVELAPAEDTELEDSSTPEKPKSFLSRAWSAASSPLTTAPSRFARQVSDYLTDPNQQIMTPTGEGGVHDFMARNLARVRGGIAGGLEGVGDLVSGMSSPINLATTIATLGEGTALKAGYGGIARGLNLTAKALAAPMIVEGGEKVFSPESTLAERGMGLTEMAGGGAAMLHTPSSVKSNAPIKSTELPAVATETPKQKFNMGQVIVIKSDKATPQLVKKAREQGFEFEGLNDQGHFRFKKTSEPTIQPILESEIPQGHIGNLADVKKGSITAEALNFPRSVMASMDFSAPLRQGLGLIHKKQFWTSLDDMFKSWGSEEGFRQVQQSIADKPLFRPRQTPAGKPLPSFAESVGLKLTDLTDLSSREEALMSTWAEKIPGVRRSNRAYTGFLNKLRADTFESLIDQGKIFGADGQTNIPLAKELANFVNTASGRGNLGRLEQSATALNSVFFSPRLIASRLQMLNPMYYVMANPMVRKEALKSLFAIAAAGNIVTQLGKMAGGTVEADPTSSDFGKLRIGNARLDPYGGFQQYIVAANRLVQGRIKSSTTGNEYNLGEKFGRPTRLDVVERFGESKLNPALSFAVGILRGKSYTGQPFDVPEEIASRFIPIFLQDLKTILTEDPRILSIPESVHPENLPMVIGSLFGMGSQYYESK